MSKPGADVFHGGKVPLFCPRCTQVGFAENLTVLCDTVHKIWQLTMAASDPQLRETYRQYMGDLAVQMKPKRLGDIVKKEGCLKMLCQTCITDLSEEAHRKAGMQVLRVGNYLFDKAFFEANEEEIRKKLFK